MTRRRIAAALLAFCGAFLLVVWRDGYVWFWIWEHSGFGATEHAFPFGLSLHRMEAVDFVLKIAGIAFVAAALLVWPARPLTEGVNGG